MSIALTQTEINSLRVLSDQAAMFGSYSAAYSYLFSLVKARIDSDLEDDHGTASSSLEFFALHNWFLAAKSTNGNRGDIIDNTLRAITAAQMKDAERRPPHLE